MMLRSALMRTAIILGALSPVAAAAQTPTASPVSIELNRLEGRSEGCRIWLVLRNPGQKALDPLRLDLLVFGRDGVVSRRLALDVGPLPGDKTMARIFDLNGQDCGGIGMLLLNDLLACGPEAEGRAACLSRLTLSSRVDGVTFEK
ncbi:Tat pathway signal protein [Pseudoroseomonas globiformis]|uniref:Tat pathway signal protein n=1 Tax=Teichococcus globiformis TaxID=2307229 RepID=A0ABV7FZF8_9PROT